MQPQTAARPQQQWRHLAAATLLMLGAGPVRADVAITNLPNGTDGGSSISGLALKSLIFSTGTTPALIQSIQLGLNPPLNTPTNIPIPLPITRNITLSLWSTSSTPGSPRPINSLASSAALPVTISALRQIYTFDTLGALGSTTLAANTSYGLTLASEGPTVFVSGVRWGSTGRTLDNTARSPTGLNGYSYLTFYDSDDAGLTWNTVAATFNTIVLSVTPIELDAEAYAAFQSVGLNALRLQRETLMQQAGQCKSSGWSIAGGSRSTASSRPGSKTAKPTRTPLCVFATGGNANANLRGRAGLNGYDAALAGGYYGIEVQTSPTWTIGAAYGYGTAALSNLGATNNSVSSTINSAAMYGVYRPDHQWAFRALAGYSAFHLNGQRYPITIGHTNPISGNTTAQGATAALQADYSIPLSQATARVSVQLKPMLGLAYGAYQQNGFSESGDPIMNLNVASNTSQSLVGTVGAELNAAIPLNPARTVLFKPRLAVAYQVDALANSDGNTAVEASLPGAGASAISNGLNRGANDLTITGSLDVVIAGQASLYALATYETFSTGSQLAYGGGVKISF